MIEKKKVASNSLKSKKSIEKNASTITKQGKPNKNDTGE